MFVLTALCGHGRCRAVQTVLAAVLIVVGFSVFPVGSASAHTPPGAETRVGPSTPETIIPVGVWDRIAAAQGWDPPVLGRQIVVATGVATNTGDDLVDVWRVVGPEEAADVARTGAYRVQPGGEGKYFFPSLEQAQNLGRVYTKAGWGGQQTLTRGQAPRSAIDRAEPVNAVSEGPGWFIRTPDIPSICNVTCVGPVK